MNNITLERLAQHVRGLASGIESAGQQLQPVMPPIMNLIFAMTSNLNVLATELSVVGRAAILSGQGQGARNIRTDMMRAHFLKTGKPAQDLPSFAYVPITAGPTDPAHNNHSGMGFSINTDVRRKWWPLYRLIQLDKFQLRDPLALPGFVLSYADKVLTVEHLQADGAFTATMQFKHNGDSLNGPAVESTLVAHYEDNETYTINHPLASERWLCDVLCPELYRQNELVEETPPTLNRETFFTYLKEFEARHPDYMDELKARGNEWRFNNYAHAYNTRLYGLELHAFGTGVPIQVAITCNLDQYARFDDGNEKRRIQVYVSKDYDPESELFGPSSYNRGEIALDNMPVVYQQQILAQLPRAQEKHLEELYQQYAVPRHDADEL